MAKYVRVGGVVSLGEGIAPPLSPHPRIARHQSHLLKLDPYINVDPGTMSPFQHGEVFVTEDGAETDLDLGHYERFQSARMHRNNNFTTPDLRFGDKKERPRRLPRPHGAVIPHITDEIKHSIARGAGGSRSGDRRDRRYVGDIESLLSWRRCGRWPGARRAQPATFT